MHIVDLFFLQLDSTHVYEPVAKTVSDIHDILPLKLRPFGNLLLPSPQNPLKYIMQNYPDSDKKDCHLFNCTEVRHKCGFVYRVPVLNNFLEVVIKNFTVLHVLLTDDTVVLPPYR